MGTAQLTSSDTSWIFHIRPASPYSSLAVAQGRCAYDYLQHGNAGRVYKESGLEREERRAAPGRVQFFGGYL